MSKNKGIIQSVKIGVDGNMCDYFDSFLVKTKSNEQIYIDPLVGDNFCELLDDMSQDEQVDWAREQVGKTLFYGDLSASNYIVVGKSYII